MKSKRIRIICLGALATLAISGTYKTATTGAPIGSTGAPGETTCGRSGCHIGDNNINTGEGRLEVSVKDFNGSYTPGKTYRVTVSMQQPGIKRFGFSAVALNAANKSTGAIEIADESRIQLMAGSNRFEGRSYATYRPAGTAPYSPGKGQWTFSWKAPAQDEGPVTFYAAAVSANNDGTDKGDEVYTTSLISNTGSNVQQINDR